MEKAPDLSERERWDESKCYIYKLGFFFITFLLCVLLVHRKFTRREQIMLVHCTMLVRSIHWVFYIHIECTVEEREMERDAVHISFAFGIVQLWVTWLLNNVTHSQKKNKKPRNISLRLQSGERETYSYVRCFYTFQNVCVVSEIANKRALVPHLMDDAWRSFFPHNTVHSSLWYAHNNSKLSRLDN